MSLKVSRYVPLEGILNLTDFVNLEELECSYEVDKYNKENHNKITKLVLPNNSKLKKLVCCGTQLTSLDLSNCASLKVLDCSFNNQLTQIIFPKNNQLKEITAQNNLLTNLEFANLNFNTLVYLNLKKNNFEATDISVLSHLINLEELLIGNDNKDWIEQNIYNRFTGSLKSLQNFSILRELEISDTDINKGVEYLSPFSIKRIEFSTYLRENCQLKRISNELEEFTKDYQSFINKNYSKFY